MSASFVIMVTSHPGALKPTASSLTAEGVVAPVNSYALLGTVSSVGCENGAVTGLLWSTAANL